jgi:hypothetical protein
MNTACTNNTMGVGEYRTGAPYSEMKVLMQEGESLMRTRGFDGESLHRAIRIYARTMRHFYEQSGWQPLTKELEEEFVGRVIAEVGTRPHGHNKSTALTTTEFNFGLTAYDPHRSGLEPITPAVYPEPETHRTPNIPEEFVEPAPDLIIDQQISRYCTIS